jgi:hypothetical protein
MKAFASRDQDWRDVRMTLIRSGPQNLDWPYITAQLTPLAEAKEAPEILTRLAALRKECRALP